MQDLINAMVAPAFLSGEATHSVAPYEQFCSHKQLNKVSSFFGPCNR